MRPAAGTNVVASAFARDKQERGPGSREPLPQVPIFLNARQRFLDQAHAFQKTAAVRDAQGRGNVALEDAQVNLIVPSATRKQ